VIALSAGTLASEREEALAAGMNDFLNKQLDPRHLQSVLHEHIAGARRTEPPARLPGALVAGAPVPEPGLAPPSAAWAAVTCLDHRVAFERMAGDEALMVSALRRLLGEFGDFCDETAPTDLDAAARHTLAARLHKLKGIAGMVEARRVHNAAQALEDLLRAQATEAAFAQLWPRLAWAMVELDEGTRALRAETVPPTIDVQGAAPLGDEALATFRLLLLGQDLDALAFFASHRAALAQRFGPDAVVRLAGLLDALDFEIAAGLVEQHSPA
jgi:HPt (histidine-containing phosphotransfer) domain-containing protein